MTKQEQIEEMARVACEHFDYDMVDQPCTKCKTHEKHCYTIHQAEILYNAGYRKIDDDCAVITKDDLKLYKKQAVKDTAKEICDLILEHWQGHDLVECDWLIVAISEKYGVDMK